MNRSSDPLDPLLGCSLFPNLNFSSHSSNPYDFDHHLHVLNRHLKSTTASLSGLRDHAKNILNGASGVKRSDMSQVKGLNGVVPGNVVEHEREKRQGLGLKRPRFSLKPNSSQPDISLGSKFDSKSLKNPEDFFTVFERNENADREVREMEKKMGGAILDGDEHNPSLTTRARRPGLMRGPVKYRHRISSHQNEIEEAICIEETFETSTLKHSSQTESHETVALEEMNLAGSKVKEDNKQNSDFLNELLSQPTEELEGDGAVRLLKERFNIKFFDLDTCLQQFPDTQKTDLKSSRINLLNPRCVKLRQGEKGSIHLASPRPPKSSLASWPELMRRSLESSPSNDPYSASDIDQVPVTNPSSDENRNKQSDQIDISEQNMISDKLKSSLIKQSDKIEGSKTGSCEVAIKKITNASERSTGDSLSKPGDGSDVYMVEEIGGSKVTSETSSMQEDCTYTRANGIDNSSKVGDNLQVAGPEVNAANSKFNSAHSQVADDVIDSDEMQEEDRVQEVMPECNVVDSTLEKLNRAPSQVADTVITYNVVQEQDKLQDAVAGVENGFDAADSSVENLNDAPSQLDQLHCTAVEEHPRDGLSRNPDVGVEKQNEIMQEHSRVSLGKPIEAKSRSRGKQKKKEVSKRQSLAGHGTSWKSGVRRSTRIRTRPLEYWKGERLLIGRVHDSLPTVIGMKYASPGKGEGLKVKSFVSDKHKGLVDLVSLH